MALDEVAETSGTLEYVVGSHKWGLSHPTGSFHAPENYKEDLEIYAKKNNKVLDIIKVKVLDVDQRGRIKLSMKEAKES